MAHPLPALLRSSRRVVVPSSIPFSLRSYSATPTGKDQAQAAAQVNTKPPIRTVHKQDPRTGPSRRPASKSILRDVPKLEEPLPAGLEVTKTALLHESSRGKKPSLYFSLRDACKCPKCVDPHSKQRNFRTTDIHPFVAPRNIRRNGQQIEIKWTNDIKGYDESHTSVYNLEELQWPNRFVSDNTGTMRLRKRWNAYEMSKYQHWISYDDYMNDEAKLSSAMRSLAAMGMIFVKDIPDSREMVEKIATRMGPLRNTFYGPTWDVRTVPEAKNVAYTSQFLDFHMDLMYMNEPPGFQLLHCLENSCDGGESLFVDTVNAAEDMQTFAPDHFKTLTEFNLSYEYVHDNSVYYNSWPVFEVARSRHDNTQQVRHVNYSPPFQSNMLGKRRSYEALERGRRALCHFENILQDKENIFELKLKPGECVIFENRRVAHARRHFNTNSGKRWLAGAYVDEDALISRFRVSRNNHPDPWNKRIRYTEPHGSQTEQGKDELKTEQQGTQVPDSQA
ncbi:hypothetical protein ASPWEDRAFT_176561 [Aspergillus wentii DTO 134E9]|uniref:TauD/TfdA-like domain-containing protein n=1 Tax=Aspergillus wentii DTO 134E9 TaxID=1073089 RepID=A0A1L9R992_ASPWE|nr:uncharacterized protein ASPWEDRAFT_176561 [Aspergillus wentii DTO 134E9]KAI9926467.1 hypothetical protein MW887_004232 [Aspergillus wentii]OJJ31494.1 hypothetical protein ASPWEDRAFT_176561 [Aspergillus wentii DTO 134E9]